jgi:GTP-binding protein HflX
MTAVTAILRELDLDAIPRMLVFNKCDRLPVPHVEPLCRRYRAIGISALHPQTLRPLLAEIEAHLPSLMAGRRPASAVSIHDDTTILASHP